MDKKHSHCMFEFILKYVIQFSGVISILIVSCIILYINNYILISNILLSILTGITSSIIVQAIIEYHSMQTVRFRFRGMMLNSLKDLSMSNIEDTGTKMECINYIHSEIDRMTDMFYELYNSNAIYNCYIDKDVLTCLCKLEQYTRINMHTDDKKKIDKKYITFFMLMGSEYWSVIFEILHWCINTWAVWKRDEHILKNVGISKQEYIRVKEFMIKSIRDLK